MDHPASKATRKGASAPHSPPRRSVARQKSQGASVTGDVPGKLVMDCELPSAVESKSQSASSFSAKAEEQQPAQDAAGATSAPKKRIAKGKKREPNVASVMAPAASSEESPTSVTPSAPEKKTRKSKPTPLTELSESSPPALEAPIVAPVQEEASKPASKTVGSRKRGKKSLLELEAEQFPEGTSALKRSRAAEAFNLYEAAMTAFNQMDFFQARDVLQLFISDFSETGNLVDRARAFLKICEQRIESAK